MSALIFFRSRPAGFLLYRVLCLAISLLAPSLLAETVVSIAGEQFQINGQPTYTHRAWEGKKIEGLLLNARLVQGVFDDLNPATVSRWAYPDTGKWDAERNTREFIGAMAQWRTHGLLAFTINFQGGSPEGYSKGQPWINSAFRPDGSLRADYAGRMGHIIEAADKLGMVVILGYFYFGQDQRLTDEPAVLRAVDEATAWVLKNRWRNVVIEVNNECDIAYDHPILQPDRVRELILRVQQARSADGHRLLVSTSFSGGKLPRADVAAAADFILLHGNGVKDPAQISALVKQTRQLPGYTPKPIVFNEDDHFDFDSPANNFTSAIGAYAGWGYFDYRMKGESFDDGYQSMPANWAISSPRKAAFFKQLARITGEEPRETK